MTIETLIQKIANLPRDGRQLVAVAGAPASGKSTLAEQLADLVCRNGREARVVPMDGFHLDNRIIEPMGLLPRKGAPETFDAAGFLHLMKRMRTESALYYPLFDRRSDQSVAGAGYMPPDCDIAIVEGNYLMFDEAVWRDLAPIWAFSVQIDVPVAELSRRLVSRWLDHGLDARAATARAESNDLPNARRVTDHSLPADYVIKWSGDTVS
jgi:fructokinase